MVIYEGTVVYECGHAALGYIEADSMEDIDDAYCPSVMALCSSCQSSLSRENIRNYWLLPATESQAVYKAAMRAP